MYANEGKAKKKPTRTAPKPPPNKVRDDVERINALLEERDAEAWKANVRAEVTSEPFDKWRARAQKDYRKQAPPAPFGTWATQAAVERLGQGQETPERYRTAGLAQPSHPFYPYADEAWQFGKGLPPGYGAPLGPESRGKRESGLQAPIRGPGLQAPMRSPGPPWERFMEQSVYPPFDRFGQQTPFWSPLMSIGETGQGEDWWRYLDYWNWLMSGPRGFMGGG